MKSYGLDTGKIFVESEFHSVAKVPLVRAINKLKDKTKWHQTREAGLAIATM